jgi:hypothetical protein
MKKIIKYSEIKSKIKQEIKYDFLCQDNNFEYFDGTLEIKGDFTLDDIQFYNSKNNICGFFIDGDLVVNGNIINYDEEFGQTLIVTGNVYANNIIAGGGELYFYEKTFIKYFYLARYGHGNAYLDNMSCKIAIVADEHGTSVNKLNCKVAFSPSQLSPQEADHIHGIGDLYFSDKQYDFYELLEDPSIELFENKKYNTLLLNYFDYEELSYIFEKHEYYKNKFLDIEKIEYRHEEDIINIVDIIDEVLSGKEKSLIEYILDVISNNDFLQKLKYRATERFNAE